MADSSIWVKVFPPQPSASQVAAVGGTVTEYTGDGTNGVLGQKYRVHTFTADSDFVVTTGGRIAALLVGGGGPGTHFTYGGAGGGGGEFMPLDLHLDPGTYRVTVGAAGAQPGGNLRFNYVGGTSRVVGGNIDAHAVGGGAGGGYAGPGLSAGVGASAGGAGINDANTIVASLTGGAASASGGGGAGGPASGMTGGAGKVSRITGAAVTYCAGGNGRANDDNPANNVPTPTGQPGRGGNAMDDPGPGYLGNDGVVIFRYEIA